MSGIYIHIPYCRQKCHYCNFYSLASSKSRKEFIHALIHEIGMRKDYLNGDPVETIYIGGGTPSLFREGELETIFDAILARFFIRPGAEITLEANPDDMDNVFMDCLKSTPVNRLSIGVQSFRDEDLVYLNRVHSAHQAEKAVRLALEHGYRNLSIDLIYGIPTLGDADLIRNLEIFFSFKINHLSAYALTVEPKTALDVLIRKGKIRNIDEERMAGQFLLLMRAMKERDFIHYEISNFSRENYFARHNTNYWLGKKYLGLGPSAHSFDGNSRQWNVAHLDKYISGMMEDEPVIEKEILTLEQKYNEYILVSLRTAWGVDQNQLLQRFGIKFRDYFLSRTGKFTDNGLLECHGDSFVTTEKGKLHADGIAADLFWAEDTA